MAIEIRNLSITSKIVQRAEHHDAGQGGPGTTDEPPRSTPPRDEWRVEARRAAAELLELRRER